MKQMPNPKKMRRIKGPKLSLSQLNTAKVRITTYLDQDILDNLRRIAEDSGSKYQTVLNQLLRSYLFGKKEGIVARLERLEETVFSD